MINEKRWGARSAVWAVRFEVYGIWGMGGEVRKFHSINQFIIFSLLGLVLVGYSKLHCIFHQYGQTVSF